jgi:hypothetical protein
MIDGPLHGRFERFDGVTLEIDLVAKIRDMTREQPKFRLYCAFVIQERKLTIDRPHPRRECGIGS